MGNAVHGFAVKEADKKQEKRPPALGGNNPNDNNSSMNKMRRILSIIRNSNTT